MKRGAVADHALDQIDVGGGARHVGALRQIRRGGLELLQAKLVGNRVLVEDVRQTFYFTCSRSEKGDLVAGFHQRPGLGDRHLDIAVEAHGGAGGDVGAGFPAVGGPGDIQLLKNHLRSTQGLARKLFPAEEDAVGIVGRGAIHLFQARPQPLDRGLHLIRLIPDHDRTIHQGKHRCIAGPQHRSHQFPAGEHLARRRQVAARDIGGAHEVVQFTEEGA